MASFRTPGMQKAFGSLPLSKISEHGDLTEFSESESSGSEEDRAPPQPHRYKWQAYACLSITGLCFVIMIARYAVLGAASPGGDATRERDAGVDFGEKVMIVSQPSETPATLAGMPVGQVLPALPGAEAGLNGTLGLLPTADLSDGNVCADNEELLDGLCYKKCSLLTGGLNTIRTSPWTCCEERPCTLNQKFDISARVACTGFAVGGDGSCPHKPGACLKDEELYLGICYKKCSILTDHAYPFRVAPATCCEDSGLSCLDFRRDYTSQEFAVGGGQANPGACQEDEELLLGECYKKCSLLTQDEYPLRLTAATCCKANSRLPHRVDGVWHLGCLDPLKDKTSASFNTAGDSSGEVANLRAHYPLQNLTEVPQPSSMQV